MKAEVICIVLRREVLISLERKATKKKNKKVEAVSPSRFPKNQAQQ